MNIYARCLYGEASPTSLFLREPVTYLTMAETDSRNM
jgi:hypothetical protein